MKTEFLFEDNGMRVAFRSNEPEALDIVEELMDRLLPLGDVVEGIGASGYPLDDTYDYADYLDCTCDACVAISDEWIEPSDADLDAIEAEEESEGDEGFPVGTLVRFTANRYADHFPAAGAFGVVTDNTQYTNADNYVVSFFGFETGGLYSDKSLWLTYKGDMEKVEAPKFSVGDNVFVIEGEDDFLKFGNAGKAGVVTRTFPDSLGAEVCVGEDDYSYYYTSDELTLAPQKGDMVKVVFDDGYEYGSGGMFDKIGTVNTVYYDGDITVSFPKGNPFDPSRDISWSLAPNVVKVIHRT